jgi:hypothetical protein
LPLLSLAGRFRRCLEFCGANEVAVRTLWLVKVIDRSRWTEDGAGSANRYDVVAHDEQFGVEDAYVYAESMADEARRADNGVVSKNSDRQHA